MSDALARRLAWAAFLLSLLLLVAWAAFDLATKSVPGHPRSAGDMLFSVAIVAFPAVAIAILSRQPRNRIGWILMAIALGWAIGPEAYGRFALSRGLPGGTLAIAISAPMWAPAIGLMGTTLLLRFPDGRLMSPRWRKVEWVAAAAISVTFVAILFAPGDLGDSGYPNLTNPLGVDALKPLTALFFPLILLIPVTIVASAVSLVMRFRRSTGTQRLQLKWLATAGAALALVYLVAMIVSIPYSWGGGDTPGWVSGIQESSLFFFVLIPIAIGVAILRYRLYDIDRIINRTLVYGSLTAVLAGVYVGLAVGLGSVTVRDNSVVIAGSTLVVAALFRPARRRIQGFIDRRFYRRKYDAQRTLEAFTARLRDQVDLDELHAHLLAVVDETVRPASMSLWLREGET